MNQRFVRFFKVLMFCILVIATNSCQSPMPMELKPAGTDDAFLKEKLVEMGFQEDMIEDYGSFFLVEGDIQFDKNDVLKALTSSRQARFQNIVGDYRALKVRVDSSIPTSGSRNWRTEISQAIGDWNGISSCGLRLTLTTATNQDILIQSDGGVYSDMILTTSNTPISGKAGKTIKINIDTSISLTSAIKRSVMVHAIGHNIGFRHTDWKNRGETNGLLVPGTVESDPNSVMNSMGIKAWAGFSSYDLIAARRLFPTTYPLVPPYSPGYWNNSSTIRINNNCYNYACNNMTNNFAQPGYASGNSLTTFFTTSDVLSFSQKDGLEFAGTSLPSSVPVGKALVALVYGRNVVNYGGTWYPDYHWYRRDSGNTWSHKPGGTAAKNTDYAGKTITDPRTADRRVSGGGNYNQFLGYFFVYSAYDQGQGREYIKGSRTLRALVSDRGLKVTLQVFSGRENPSFYINDQKTIEQIKTLYNRNNHLLLKEMSAQSKLDNRGVLVENPGKIDGLPNEFMVFDGTIETPEAGLSRGISTLELSIHNDIDKALEKVIMDSLSREELLEAMKIGN